MHATATRRRLAVAFTTAVVVALAGCSGSAGVDEAAVVAPSAPPASSEGSTEAASPTAESQKVLDVLRSDGRFDTLVRIIEEEAEPHFVRFMSDPRWDLTLFAPTDDAFDALDPELLQALLDAPPRQSATGPGSKLTRVLDHHIAMTYLRTDEMTSGPLRAVGAGGVLEIAVAPDGITVDGANIVDGDIEVSNGIVHAVDRVLIPDGVEAD